MRYLAQILIALAMITLSSYTYSQCDAPAPMLCDADGDRDVDSNDITAISTARGSSVSGPGDIRDIDGDGMISVLDARQCVALCDEQQCIEWVPLQLSNEIEISYPSSLVPKVDFLFGVYAFNPLEVDEQEVSDEAGVGIYVALHENPNLLSVSDYYDGDPQPSLGPVFEVVLVGGRSAYRYAPEITLSGDVIVVVPLDGVFLYIADHGSVFQKNGIFDSILESVKLGD